MPVAVYIIIVIIVKCDQDGDISSILYIYIYIYIVVIYVIIVIISRRSQIYLYYDDDGAALYSGDVNGNVMAWDLTTRQASARGAAPAKPP